MFTSRCMFISLFLLSVSIVRAMDSVPNQVEVLPSTDQSKLPFKVVVNKVVNSQRITWNITVHGSRTKEGKISAWLELRGKDDRRLTVGMHLNEKAENSEEGLIFWSISVSIDIETAKECAIGIFTQLDPDVYDFEPTYRIPLEPWLAQK